MPIRHAIASALYNPHFEGFTNMNRRLRLHKRTPAIGLSTSCLSRAQGLFNLRRFRMTSLLATKRQKMNRRNACRRKELSSIKLSCQNSLQTKFEKVRNHRADFALGLSGLSGTSRLFRNCSPSARTFSGSAISRASSRKACPFSSASFTNFRASSPANRGTKKIRCNRKKDSDDERLDQSLGEQPSQIEHDKTATDCNYHFHGHQISLRTL